MKKKLDVFDRAEKFHEVYGNLDAPDDVDMFYHAKRLLGAVSLGIALLLFIQFLVTL